METHGRFSDCTLPPDGNVARWTPARKEAVVLALRSKEITVTDTLRRWNISVEELDRWITEYRRKGRRGLKALAPQQGRLL